MSELANFMESAKLVYVRLDLDGRILACNPYLAELTGWRRQDMLGVNWFHKFLAPDVRETLSAVFSSAVKDGGIAIPQSNVNEILTKTGEARVVAWNNDVDIGRGGRILGVSCVGVDVTDQKRYEADLREARRAAEEANASKTRYLAHASHELRTPLNSIIGFSEIMCGELFGPMPNRYREYSELIHRSGTHLHRIINDILDITKIEAGRMDLDFEDVSVSLLVGEAIELVRGQALENEVSVISDWRRDCQLRVDRLRAKQVIVNILSNAIKFAPGTVVNVRLKLAKSRCSVVISDDGPGMDEAALERALQPFGQVSEIQIRRRQSGTGLGLPLSKSLMELLGGSLDVDSIVDGGTTVTLSFPRRTG